MGAEPWWYVVNYQTNLEKALQELRQREFEAGRYNPVVPNLEFPIDGNSPSPGAQHRSIKKALEASEEDETRSILDMQAIGEYPAFGIVSPLDDDILEELFGTSHPSREQVEQHDDFLEEINRGQGVYIILYKDGQPDEILFAGYSFD